MIQEMHPNRKKPVDFVANNVFGCYLTAFSARCTLSRGSIRRLPMAR
jgi:hypothetical protein